MWRSQLLEMRAAGRTSPRIVPRIARDSRFRAARRVRMGRTVLVDRKSGSRSSATAARAARTRSSAASAARRRLSGGWGRGSASASGTSGASASATARSGRRGGSWWAHSGFPLGWQMHAGYGPACSTLHGAHRPKIEYDWQWETKQWVR